MKKLFILLVLLPLAASCDDESKKPKNVTRIVSGTDTVVLVGLVTVDVSKTRFSHTYFDIVGFDCTVVLQKHTDTVYAGNLSK